MESKKILMIVGSSILAALVGIGLLWMMMSFSYTNRAIGLENQAKAQQEANQATYDTVWKTIKQKAQISDKYESQFKKVYVDIMQQRQYGKGGEMFKFVMEANPQFDSSLAYPYLNL
jgi:archaellum component FlaF (FlaF/FlaG flagellin family)